MPLIGLALIGFVVWLGTKASSDSSLTLWFGLASATMAPIGVALLLESLRSRATRVLDDLSKVPAIEDLVNQAATKEEQVRQLEEARTRLEEIVRIEARRQTIKARRELLLEDATRIVEEVRLLEV